MARLPARLYLTEIDELPGSAAGFRSRAKLAAAAGAKRQMPPTGVAAKLKPAAPSGQSQTDRTAYPHPPSPAIAGEGADPGTVTRREAGQGAPAPSIRLAPLCRRVCTDERRPPQLIDDVPNKAWLTTDAPNAGRESWGRALREAEGA